MFLVDTSVAIPLVMADHEHHSTIVSELGSSLLGLAGHAAFEAYSVLTRMAPPARRTPSAVDRLLSENFPETRFLSEPDAARLLRQLPALGISGGAVYDALVGAVAVASDLELVSRDLRAAEIYRVLNVRVRLLI